MAPLVFPTAADSFLPCNDRRGLPCLHLKPSSIVGLLEKGCVR